MAKRNIVLMVGPNSNRVISEHLSKLNDSIELSSYDTFQNLIKVSTMRHKFFERIVFSSKILSGSMEKDLKLLSSYLYEYSSGTSLVFIVKDDQKDLVKKFYKVFKSPLYTAAIIGSPTTKDLMNTISLDIDEIRERYAKSGVLKSEEMPKEGEITKERHESPKEEKKVGFFGRLFGKKEKSGSKEGLETQNVEEEINEIEESSVNSFDVGSLSLGGLYQSHADTGYLDSEELDLSFLGREESSLEFLSFPVKDPIAKVVPEMEDLPVRKPPETHEQMGNNLVEINKKESFVKSAEVLVGGVTERESLTGKLLLIGTNNSLDENVLKFDKVVDLDTESFPIRAFVDLKELNNDRLGISKIIKNNKEFYTEGYLGRDINFRGSKLIDLIKRSNSICVNARVEDLDDIVESLGLFDTIKIQDNNGLELYFDLDNEEKVSGVTLAKLKNLKPDTSQVSKGYLVSRRVW